MESMSRFHKFLLADFEKEAEWLNEQASQGWHLADTDGENYDFEKGMKDVWIYMTDDIRPEDDPDTYLDKYTAAGWKFVCRTNNRAYLKHRKGTDKVDVSMFTPEDERLEFVKAVANGQMKKGMPFYILGVLCVIAVILINIFVKMPTIPLIGLQVVAFLVVILLISAISTNTNELRKYKEIVKIRKNPESGQEISLEEAIKKMEKEEK